MADVQCLTQTEIDKFVDTLDKDRDGCISYIELEHGLDAVYRELQPDSKHHHLHHSSRKDHQRHEFLRSLIGSEKDAVPIADFKNTVVSWKIPSLECDKKTKLEEIDYLKRISRGRRLYALWEVHGPEYVFLAMVVALQIGLGVWQCVKYATGPQYQAALGWGVGLSKACAGALYPTLFFLVFSMSRMFSTLMRRFYYVSRFVNWDRSHSFHIKISIVALALSTLHTIGHLGGTFVFGSRPDRQEAVAALWGSDAAPKSYLAYVQSIPGWTGLTALGIFYVIALLSIPYVKKYSYELFQLGHLLMFPMIGMLMAHGTAALLQFPVLGLVLAFPTLLVIIERATRILSGFHKIPAKLDILDEDTVCITCTIPKRRIWNYEAGQYVFLQVPQLSFFQWHPFTVSTCIGRQMQLHIKTDGDWTGKLHNLTELKYVGIDGPFGAPAQRFYDFDQTIVVGAGIGITPFSGILADLQTREDHGWNVVRDSSFANESEVDRVQVMTGEAREIDLGLFRRVDFHWIVRDKNYLLWFSDLLNRISSGEHNPSLDVRIHNYLTEKRDDLSVHIYRWLLEKHRTNDQAVSPLTGLIAPTHFGRPDFRVIMENHYEEMLELFSRDRKRKRKVGVFYCGAPVVGVQLADLCHQLTLRGREDRNGIEYHFQIEVFN